MWLFKLEKDGGIRYASPPPLPLNSALTLRTVGNSLLKKIVLAIPEAMYYWRALCGLEEGLNEEHPGHIAEWEVMLANWEADPSKPCPYDSKEPGM